MNVQMLEDLMKAFIASQFGDVKKRTAGVALEVVAFSFIGLAIAFLALSCFLWLSTFMEMWLAALTVSALVFGISGVLILVGRSMMQRKAIQQESDITSAIEALASLTSGKVKADGENPTPEETNAAIFGVALAAGVILGRAFKR